MKLAFRVVTALALVASTLAVRGSSNSVQADKCGHHKGNLCWEWEVCLMGFCVGEKYYYDPEAPVCWVCSFYACWPCIR